MATGSVVSILLLSGREAANGLDCVALVFWTLSFDRAGIMLKTLMICFLDYLGMAGQFKLRQSGI